MSSERKTAKKPIQVFRSFPTDAVSETKSIESDNPIQIRLARNITISSLYSFSLISLQSLDVNLPRQSTREIAKSLKTAHTQERGEPRRKSTEELPKDRLGTIQQLLEDFTQKQRPKKIGSVLSRLSQDPETQSDLVKNKLTESLEEKIQRLFTKENIVPFAVAILRMSREESIDLGRLFDYDKQAVNYKESTEEYEILPISQLGFLYLISLSTQINRFIDLLTVVQAYQIEKQVSLIEYIDSLFAQEEMKTVLKNQTTNISIIIWYMVQVIRSIGLFNIIFTFTP